MYSFLPFIVVLVLFLILDLPVILYLNKNMYEKQFNRINKQDIKSGYHTWFSGIFAYLLLALGIYFFIVYPELNNNNNPVYTNILIKSMFLGLVIYGVYNGTNMATINEWGLTEFAVDTTWGTILSGIIGTLSVYIIKSKLK